MKKYIEFKKQRELGDILSDTFAFLRSEFKPFFNTFLKIVGPYLLVMLICYGLYMYKIGDFFQFTVTIGDSPSEVLITAVIALLLAASFVATYSLSTGTVLFYIKSYNETKGTPIFEDVKRNAYGAFWQFVGLAILVGLCVGVGLMLCLIPGIYLYVALSVSFSILAFTGKSVSDAFSYSFSLVKDNWWMTFAALFVVGIIVTVASYAFALPATIYTYMKMGIFSGEIDAENFDLVDPVSIVLGIISTLAQFLMNIITVIASVFIYFDLNEKKNFTGTYERIKNLGDTE